MTYKLVVQHYHPPSGDGKPARKARACKQGDTFLHRHVPTDYLTSCARARAFMDTRIRNRKLVNPGEALKLVRAKRKLGLLPNDRHIGVSDPKRGETSSSIGWGSKPPTYTYIYIHIYTLSYITLTRRTFFILGKDRRRARLARHETFPISELGPEPGVNRCT